MNRFLLPLMMLGVPVWVSGSGLIPGEIKEPAEDQRLAAPGARKAAAHAHYLLGRQLEAEGHMQDALAHYLAYLKQSDGQAFMEMLPHIASLAATYDGLEKALDILEQSITEQPGSASPVLAFCQLALTSLEQEPQLRERLVKVVEQALMKFPDRAEIYQNAVTVYLATGSRDKAQMLLEKTLEAKQKEPHFWLELGRAAQDVWPIADNEHRDGHVAKINPYFEKAGALALEERSEEAALQTVDYFIFTNQFPKAIAVCESTVRQTGSLDSRKRLWRLYDASEREAEAQQALLDLVDAFPLDIEHHRILSNRFRSKKQFEQAVQHLEAAVQAGGGEVDDYLWISQMLMWGKDEEKLDRFTSRGKQLFPEDPRMGFQRACALTRLNRYGEAVELFTRVEKTAETELPGLLHDLFYFSYGSALERSGQYEEAARQFDKSIQLTPPERLESAARTMNYLGYMWLEQNHHLDKAEQLIKKANELVMNEPAFIDSLGWLYYKQGKHAQALTELLRAEQLMEEVTSEDAEIFEHIALTYERLDNGGKAREYWQRVLDLKPTDEKFVIRARKGLGLEAPKGMAPDEKEKEKDKEKMKVETPTVIP